MSEIFISEPFYHELTRICVDALPHKAFGLVSGTDLYHPKTIYPCKTNLRNEPEWKSLFESFGEFYKDPDLGFVIAHPEVKTVMESIDSRGESFIGVFHSHRFLRAEPSEIDIFLNSDPGLLSYIVSVVNPSNPQVGVFHLNGGSYQNIPIILCHDS
jgi:proteasome lid subunit RPN8/RPN11